MYPDELRTVCIDGPKRCEVVKHNQPTWLCPLPRKLSMLNAADTFPSAGSDIETITYYRGYVSFKVINEFINVDIVERSDILLSTWSDARLIERKGAIDFDHNCFWVWTTEGFGKNPKLYIRS
jgi:hypothetical protein